MTAQTPDSPFLRPRSTFERRLAVAVSAAKPQRGVGVFEKPLPGGVSLTAKRARARAQAPSGGVLIVRKNYTVVPGTVIGLTPTIKVGSSDVPISDVPAPVLPITGTGTEHVILGFFGTLSKSADDEFVRSVEFTAIKLGVTGTAPTSADLFSDGSEAGGTPQFKVLLATFVDGVKTLQAYDQSLWFKVCDDLSRTGTCQLEQTNPPP